MNDTFGDFFSELFGFGGNPPTPPDQKMPIYHDEEEDKWFLLLLEVPKLAATYLAVQLDGPTDLGTDVRPFGKPVILVLHKAELKAYQEAKKEAAHLQLQIDLDTRLFNHYKARGETRSVASGFIRIKQVFSPWHTPMNVGIDDDDQKTGEPPACPRSSGCYAHGIRTAMTIREQTKAVPHVEMLSQYCDLHRELFNAYLINDSTPDLGWPPEPEDEEPTG
jgi:hypothetical protein